MMNSIVDRNTIALAVACRSMFTKDEIERLEARRVNIVPTMAEAFRKRSEVIIDALQVAEWLESLE